MGLCKPYPASEPDKKEEGKRKVCERDGVVYENRYFKCTMPESWNVINRLKGALTKDKYRIIAMSPAGGTELVIAQSDNYDEMVEDWATVTQKILPAIEADESKLQTLPDLVMELRQGNPRGSAMGMANPTSQARLGSMSTDTTNVGGGGHRRVSKSTMLQMQRDLFEEKLTVVQEGREPNPTKDLSNYEMVRTIGTGSFGRVLLAKQKTSGKYCAMKIIRKEIVIKLKQVEHTTNEKNILACVDCPFIIHMLEYFQDRRSLYFILEYVNGGELFTHIHRNRYFSFEVARFFAAETVLAFEYLHNLDIIYRDLKPENMLID